MSGWKRKRRRWQRCRIEALSCSNRRWSSTCAKEWHQSVKTRKEEEEEEEEEEEGLFKAVAVNEEDPERDRATPA
jgi:hypothetical protein